MKLHKRILSLMLAAAMLAAAMPAGMALAETQGEQASGKTYEVRSFADLKYLADLSKTETFEGATIELLADIELTDENRAAINESALTFGSYASIGSGVPFSGTFKGNGHTISGLKYDATISVAVSTALFSYAKGATIQDLTISDSELDADMLGGILVGYAEDTTVANSTVSGCDLSVNCVNNVLTLITDGGLVGGGLVGTAKGCTLYNCEVAGTYVHTSATAGVQALGGKGLYMGAMVGSAVGTTIEYSRVVDGSRVKNSYDMAVGALGGNKVYAGGIAGEIKGGTKVIDSFSTAELYTYCGTYVSVGAGNIGYVGGIAAASYGTNEITRCHYAGNATSKQYNAAIVIPIIQTNKNVSGISERIKDGTLTVTGSYFRPSDSPETSMKVLGDTASTSEYGPQDDATYADRSFWAGHDYDFSGTVSRSSSYSDDHANKWVMNYELGIPVHGQSVAAGFDFPGAGSVTVGATDLVDKAVSTDDAYDFAVQGFKPTTESYAVDLTAAVGDGYRFVEWYRVQNVTADSAPEGHGYFAALMEQGDAVSQSSTYSGAECVDNDLFLAHMEALVRFHDINGDVIDRTSGADSEDVSDDWYDFEQALPDVTPTSHVPESANARLIGWTTEKSTEAGGGYSSITNDALTKLRLAGSFYETGDPVEKTMDLYPVYADLVSNVITVHEGNEQDGIDDPSMRDGVGKTWVTMTEGNTATIHVGGVGSTDGSLADFPAGYRFIGWYTDDGSGNQVRVSQEQEYALDGVDLTIQRTYTAKFEYRVQFWLPARYGKNASRYVAYSHQFGEAWVPYKDKIFSATDDYNWESSYTAGLEIAYKRADWRLKYWTAAAIRTDGSGNYIEYEDYSGSDSYKALVSDETRAPRYANSGVTAPTELSAITNFGDSQLQHMYYVETDFPGSGKSAITDYGDYNANLDVQVALNDGYNFVFYDLVGKMSDSTLLHGKYAYKNSSGTLRNLTFEAPNKITWDSDEQLQTNGNYTYYYTAHITADANFHKSDGTLIGNETLTSSDYPYQSGDKTVTMTRRYGHQLFGQPEIGYTTYEKESEKSVSFATSELGTAPDAPTVDGYCFVGWVEPSQMADYERAYAFDVSNGESSGGAPQYISSSLDKAKAYTLQDDALVERAMELYPVYVKMGQISTTTNLSAAASASLNVPDDPAYSVTETADDGTQTIELQADIDEPLPGGSGGVYELLRMTVSVDGGDEVELEGDTSTGKYAYTSVEPGHSYLFTAYYRPYVVVFHQNGTTDEVVQVYNQYDPIRNAPLPTVQDSTEELSGYLFVGWTEHAPDTDEKPYLIFDAGADETVSYGTLDSIYRFVGNGTSVSHAMELWPVYVNIRVDVNSNIDAELTELGISLTNVRKVERSAADSLQTKAVATEVDGYRFVGWYRDIPSDKLADDSQYTADRLVSTDSSYRLTGDSPYESTVYTARYLKAYKVVYHDQDGSVLTTDYIYEGDDHPFERQQTLTDADGNPVKDESGNDVTVSVPYYPDAVSSLYEGMTDRQALETWLWVKSNGDQTEYASFCNKKIISECIAEDAGAGREMHLYPVVWSMSATDSTGAAYDGMVFGAKFDDDGKTVGAYFTGEEPYLQPSLTVHAEKTVWTGPGGEAAVEAKGQVGVPVTLYPEDSSSAEAMGKESTDAQGDAVFAITAALTIEKTGSAELAGQSFLFAVTDNDSGSVMTVPVACSAAEDGTATGSVTLLLPAGAYSVTEDEGWAYRYDAHYTVSYAAAPASMDGYAGNTAVAVSPIGYTGAKVACANSEKSGLSGWLNDGAHIENLFD